MRRSSGLLACACVLALLLPACGRKHDRLGPSGAGRPVRLMLDYFPNADHAGLYAAQAGGDFRRAGLSVKIETPGDPSEPLKLLAAGKVDVAISYEPEVLLARDRGLRVVSIGAIVQRPLTAIVSVGARRIRRVADLRGKRVGTAGIPYQSAYLSTILARAGVPRSSVREIDVGFNLVPAMLSGRVDATLGAFWNYEAIQLAQKGRRPGVIHVEQAGVPTYDELVLVAREDELRSHGATLRAFVQALGRGYAAARRDPPAAVEALLRANPDLDRNLQLASVEATRSSYFPRQAARPFGYQDRAQWAAFGRWMAAHRLLRSTPHGQAALTNELLAGQGLRADRAP